MSTSTNAKCAHIGPKTVSSVLTLRSLLRSFFGNFGRCSASAHEHEHQNCAQKWARTHFWVHFGWARMQKCVSTWARAPSAFTCALMPSLLWKSALSARAQKWARARARRQNALIYEHRPTLIYKVKFKTFKDFDIFQLQTVCGFGLFELFYLVNALRKKFLSVL